MGQAEKEVLFGNDQVNQELLSLCRDRHIVRHRHHAYPEKRAGSVSSSL